MFGKTWNLIFSIDNEYAIGSQQDIVYKSKVDMARFKSITNDSVIVMGYNTWTSIGKSPLKNRIHVILSKNHCNDNNSVLFAESWDKVFQIVQKINKDKVFIIGGKKIYQDFFLSYKYLISNIYITKIHNTLEEEEETIKLDNFDEIESFCNKFMSKEEDFEIKENVKLFSKDPEKNISKEINISFIKYSSKNHFEVDYLKCMQQLSILPKRKSRNANVSSSFGLKLDYNLQDNQVPILTTKRVAWKTCIKELLWFLRGDTDNKKLQKENVHIWDDNSSREFLDKVGLKENEEGDLGKVYGFQWRHWGAEYFGCSHDYTEKGYDQIQNCVELLNKDPHSRRIIVCSWNVSDLSKMALPPCHTLFQWYVDDNNLLWLQLYQRSGDFFLGVPFNMFSYAVLVRLMCIKTNLKPGGIHHIFGDAHVYECHRDAIQEQLSRVPNEEITELNINPKSSWEDYIIDDFTLNEYNPQKKILAPMVA